MLWTKWVQLGILFWLRNMLWLAYTGEREIVWYFLMLVTLFRLGTMLEEGRIRRVYQRRWWIEWLNWEWLLIRVYWAMAMGSILRVMNLLSLWFLVRGKIRRMEVSSCATFSIFYMKMKDTGQVS